MRPLERAAQLQARPFSAQLSGALSRVKVRLVAAPVLPARSVEVTATVFETHREELTALVRGVGAAHEAGDAWSDIGVLTRDNAHAALASVALIRAELGRILDRERSDLAAAVADHLRQDA